MKDLDLFHDFSNYGEYKVEDVLMPIDVSI